MSDLKISSDMEKYLSGLVAKVLRNERRQILDEESFLTAEQKKYAANNKQRLEELKTLASFYYPKPPIAQLWAETGTVTPPSFPQQSAGWGVSTLPLTSFFNYLEQRVEEFLLHINQQGICVWDDLTDYPISALSKGSDGGIYLGQSAPNVGNDPTTDGGTHWLKVVSNQSTAYGILTKTTDQTIAGGGSHNDIIPFNNVYKDPHNYYTGGNGFQLPAGVWEFDVSLSVTGNSSILTLVKNSTVVATLAEQPIIPGATSEDYTLSGQAKIQAAANDIFTCYLLANSVTACVIHGLADNTNHFEVKFVSN